MRLDGLSERVLEYLADRYRPVSSDWVETQAIAQSFGIDASEVDARCQALIARGFIELSPPDEENLGSAAIITNKGLLAIGRAP